MGGSLLPYHSESYILNPAYLDIQEEAPLSIALPLGLLAFLGNLPSFDPQAPDFDIVELADLVVNPPFYLELRHEKKSDSTNIFIDVTRNSLMADLDNLQEFVPKGPIDMGLFDLRQPRGGFLIRGIHFAVSPYILLDGRFELSDNLERALAEADPFTPDTDYSVKTSGYINAALAIHAGHVFDLTEILKREGGPRFLMGLNGKYILGFLYADVANLSGIHTHDPIFGEDRPPSVSSTTTMDYAVPESGDVGPKGKGIGFDLGFLLRYPTLDIGFGVQDLYTRLRWRANRDLVEYDEATNDVIRTSIFEDRDLIADIPRTFSMSIAYRSRGEKGWGDRPEVGDFILAYNGQVSNGDMAIHVGGETYYGPGPVALRLGAFNQGGKVQVSFGAGIPLKICNFDVALTTHSPSFQRHRGLTLATSISFP